MWQPASTRDNNLANNERLEGRGFPYPHVSSVIKYQSSRHRKTKIILMASLIAVSVFRSQSALQGIVVTIQGIRMEAGEEKAR